MAPYFTRAASAKPVLALGGAGYKPVVARFGKPAAGIKPSPAVTADVGPYFRSADAAAGCRHKIDGAAERAGSVAQPAGAPIDFNMAVGGRAYPLNVAAAVGAVAQPT